MYSTGKAAQISGAEVKKLADIFIENSLDEDTLKQNIKEKLGFYL